jgi:hypothetical protein
VYDDGVPPPPSQAASVVCSEKDHFLVRVVLEVITFWDFSLNSSEHHNSTDLYLSKKPVCISLNWHACNEYFITDEICIKRGGFQIKVRPFARKSALCVCVFLVTRDKPQGWEKFKGSDHWKDNWCRRFVVSHQQKTNKKPKSVAERLPKVLRYHQYCVYMIAL